jgi:tRNA (guanine6-N2)-methyltransferase
MKFLLTVFPGLPGLAADELQSQMKLAAMARERVRGSELLWVQSSDPARLLELRLIEDVFVEILTQKLTGKTPDLKALTVALTHPEAIQSALRAHAHLTGHQTPARVHFRVVVQADDATWRQYRRVDLQAAAEAGVMRARPGWRLEPDQAPVEIWLHQTGRELHVSLRLTSGEHRARGGRAVEREAALRPTIAAAMVYVARPQDDEVFLDPMCGSGTILLERALSGRHGLLLGGDIDPAAVKATLANFGPRHKPVRIERLDARNLPLEDASVDKFVTNLPWGRQIGRPEELPALYRAVLAEAVRVVRPGGLIVMLTSQPATLRQAARGLERLRLSRIIPKVAVLGSSAEIIVWERV